ncbi:MAG: hypothetical protein HWN65_05480 [Candidatus Helarchaeota archaeon]|nr:hypothetical protein [Candidatus Helarchaeota archaeon]
MDETAARQILVNWFKKKGYEVIEDEIMPGGNEIDLLAFKGLGDRWLVEVKGEDYSRTESYQVDFDTAMGQLMKSVLTLESGFRYAVCIPYSRTERGERLSYRRVLHQYRESMVFEALHISLIIIREDQSVEVIAPKDVRSFLQKIDPEIRV